MRVAILSHNARTGDAIGNHIAEKLRFFLDRGADVRVLIEDGRRLHENLRAHYELFDAPRISGPAWNFLESADVALVEYGHCYSLLELLPLLAAGKPRILFDYHGVTPRQFWSGPRREAAELGILHSGLTWCADAVIVHSRFCARELAGNAGLPDKRIRIMPLAIDTERFHPGAPREDLRAALGIDTGRLILFVGRLAPNKRISVLVKAFSRIDSNEPPLHLVIVGDDTDVYQSERDLCLGLARQLGVSERVHFLGQLPTERLIDAYRSADVFVMPSLHEGFCVPIAEANACGIPVIAARATALTETVADTGLTFTPDDPEDLARLIGNVLDINGKTASTRNPPLQTKLHVAVVSVRYGPDVVGGAESSLRLIAETLQSKGHQVEVFTTCTMSESAWVNELPEESVQIDGVLVHRFRIDRHDRSKHLGTVRNILECGRPTNAELEKEYLAHSLHSRGLVKALARQIDEFDAVVVGPYLFGLTHDVSTAFAEKVLLVPCFHDEPFARLSIWPTTFSRVGGILYHSAEEQEFAQCELGVNHPRAHCVGTWIDTISRGDAQRSRQLIGGTKPYLMYCGRYSPEKNLPLLLEYARKYDREQPGRFMVAFAGAGDLMIPRESWAVDLGFVSESAKRDLLRGAAAVVQLSNYESLSLAALEAWAQETPVLFSKDCAVLKAHADRSNGGVGIASYGEFEACLDSLWTYPAEWQDKGKQGRVYVEKFFGDRERFCADIVSAIREMQRTLRQCMVDKGLERAKRYSRAKWREQFGTIVDGLVHDTKISHEEILEIIPRSPVHQITAKARLGLLPVKIRNSGTLPALAKGIARWQLHAEVIENDEPHEAEITPLPCLLVPNQEVSAVMKIAAPVNKGRYEVKLTAVRADGSGLRTSCPPTMCTLIVVEESTQASTDCCTPLLQSVQTTLAEASNRSDLPDDYVDVTEGRLATWKRWLKRKLLGNFKHAYVDVLSRQQSAFNRQLVTAARDLAACCATLDHARGLQDHVEGQLGLEELTQQIKKLANELKECRRVQAALEARIDHIEAQFTSATAVGNPG
jgi:glycosyltransferase involved in cell wall biosynthesis